ncbi:hypothetical protein [Saccharospirillum mangrovi]|uniref:hypothetical protein n=1 Tax=Saccharospirillum mangrovi TaxID=2161747 RepID=UPI000D34F581|nr:hypothetical protein [Saccharospirillum mangrovi]
MDQIRIQHLDTIFNLLVEYQNKSGQLPLQGDVLSRDIEVFITHRKLPDWLITQAAQAPLDIYPNEALEAEFERVLGREIELPSDPQNVATYAPNVYVYHVNPGWACVAAHLYSPAPGTKNVQNQYYKYEKCVQSSI